MRVERDATNCRGGELTRERLCVCGEIGEDGGERVLAVYVSGVFDFNWCSRELFARMEVGAGGEAKVLGPGSCEDDGVAACPSANRASTSIGRFQ